MPRRGRPREFCVDHALAQALRVFWSKGYEGTSLTDLTEAMGITRPSLYAAFGNKESLFRKALDLYEREKLAYVGKALAQPTARKVAETMLRGAVDNVTGSDEPHGCLRRHRVGRLRRRSRSRFARKWWSAARSPSRRSIERFERAKAEGDLPAARRRRGADRRAASRCSRASRSRPTSGATREELDRLVDTGLDDVAERLSLSASSNIFYRSVQKSA